MQLYFYKNILSDSNFKTYDNTIILEFRYNRILFNGENSEYSSHNSKLLQFKRLLKVNHVTILIRAFGIYIATFVVDTTVTIHIFIVLKN